MDEILKKFIKTIKPHSSHIKKMIFFGSRARGSQRPDSDYDVLILLDQKNRQTIDHLYDGVMHCLLEFDRLISLKIFTVEQWDYLVALRTPFTQTIQKEGVSLG